MRAAICQTYGGPEVVQLGEAATPVAKANEVLIRVHATTVSSGDARVRASHFPGGFWLLGRLVLGLTRPRQPILGTELAGVIEAVGAAVMRFRPGDAVFAFSGGRFGCHAEFKTMKENGALARMPAGFSFAEAAAISFGGATALHFLRSVGKLQRGERVLVNGAAGAVGSAAVQLARHFGAHVTGVCSVGNAALVRSLGAAEAIDYNETDFATSGKRWDIIIDAVGNAPYARCRRALADKGRLLLLVGGLGDLLKAPFQSLVSGRKVSGGPAPERAQDLAVLKELCESGDYKPVVGATYPLERIAEAHALVDSGRKVGSVVVTLQ